MELGIQTSGGEDYSFTLKERQNLLVAGKGRSGKSQLLIKLALDDIHAGRKVVFIGNDAPDEVLKYIPQSRQTDTLYFNPSLQPLSANPFWRVPQERHSIVTDLFIDAILSRSAYSAGTTPVIENVVTPSVGTLLSMQVESPLSLYHLLTNETYRTTEVFGTKGSRVILDPRHAQFWDSFQRLSARDKLSRTDSTVNKLTKLVYDPFLYRSFDQAGNALSLQNGITLVSLDKYKLSDSSASLAGALVIANLLAQANPHTDTTFYIDDAEQYGSRIITQLLRHPTITTVLSTRSIEGFKPSNDILNAVHLVALRTSLKDAKALESELNLKEQAHKLNQIPKFQAYVMNGDTYAELFTLVQHSYQEPKRKGGKSVAKKIIDRCWNKYTMQAEDIAERLRRFF